VKLRSFLIDFTPIATTELIAFTFLQQQFARRNVKLSAISPNNRRTDDGEGYVSHEEWVKDIDEISQQVRLEFPIFQDDEGALSRLYNV
jgi:thioredoxin-dependent peroxiredoxin